MPPFLVFLSLLLSPETPISPPAITPAPYEQHLGGIASNGRDFLAVWLDRRSTIQTDRYILGNVNSFALYVSKLDGAGRAANPFGLKLRDAVFSASIIWTPRGYLLLWSEKNEVDAMLLDDDGVPVSAPRKLTDGYVNAAASNGHSIFIIHGPFSQSQYASVFTLDGTLLQQTTVNIYNEHQLRPFVMQNGDYAFVSQLATCPGNVPCLGNAMLTTISESGTITTKSLALISLWSKTSAALGNGRILAAWISDYTPPPTRMLRFRIVDTAGNPLTDEITLASTTAIQYISGAYAPSVGWDGSNFLIAWQWPSADEQSGQVQAVRVTTNGFVIDSSPLVLDQSLGNPPWFASNGTTQLTAWDSFGRRRSTSDINFRSAASFDTLNYAPTNILGQSAAQQTQTQLATLRSQTLAVWREGDSDPSILAAIVGASPVVVSSFTGPDQQAPSVGASANQYLIAWREESPKTFRILAKRVGSDGTVIDRNAIVIAENQTLNQFLPATNTLAVGSNGSDFFVVWPAVYDRLLGVRVSADGKVLDTSPVEVLTPGSGTAGSPRIWWNGSEYIIVSIADPSCKTCLRPPGPPVSQVLVTRVSATGQPIDSKKMWDGGYGFRVAIARGAEGLMISWAVAAGAGAPCIYAMPLGNDGSPAGSLQTVACTAKVSLPQFPDLDLTWDGTAFIAAWTEVTAEGAAATYAIPISARGTALETAAVELTPRSESFQPALASAGDGAMIVYSRIADEPQYGGVARLFRRSLAHFNSTPRRRASR